jgi:hypothetical protein
MHCQCRFIKKRVNQNYRAKTSSGYLAPFPSLDDIACIVSGEGVLFMLDDQQSSILFLMVRERKNLAFWWCPSFPKTLSRFKGYSPIGKGFISGFEENDLLASCFQEC